MSDFVGIIRKGSTNSHATEVQKMLSVMSLPHYDTRQYLVESGPCMFGQTHKAFGITPDQNYVIGFKGTLYNLQDLKQKLLDQGQMIRAETQTDILILAYQTWGPNFLEFLDGSFVLFIYCKKQKKLLLARDKIGSQRVYWGRYANTFIFGGLLKGLLASRFVPQSPCLESIASYFYLGYFPQDRTPIVNINCLLPGYYLLVDSDINIIVNKYWSFKASKHIEPEKNLQDVSHKLDHLLVKAIEKGNPSQEGMHCYLQGDIGSASIAHYAKKIHPEHSKLYSSDFSQQSNSYIPYAKSISNSIGLPLETQTYGSEDLFTNLSEIVWHLDEPVADPSSILIWNLAKNLKGKTKSLFCSLGAAEFLGFHLGNSALHYEPLFLWFLEIASPLILRIGAPLLSKLHNRSALKSLRFFQKDFWAVEYMKQNCLFAKKSLKNIAPNLYKHFDFGIYIRQTYQYLKYIHYQNFDVTDYFFYDAETMLSNYLMIQYQNLLTPEGITLFCPFLDQDVFQFLIHTPEELKSQRKKSALPLQKILEGILSAEDLSYDYQKGNHYLEYWVQKPEIAEVFKLLSRGSLVESGIISERGFNKEFLSRNTKAGSFQRLWSILILEVWFKLFINSPIHTFPQPGNLVEYLKT